MLTIPPYAMYSRFIIFISSRWATAEGKVMRFDRIWTEWRCEWESQEITEVTWISALRSETFLIPKRSSKHFMIITPAVAGDIWVWTADKNASRGEKACRVQQQCRVSVAELMNTVSYVCVFLDDTENTACFLVSLADFWVKYPALLKLNLWVCLGLNMSYILLSCVLMSWYSPWHQSGYQLSHC